jgi:4-amino-4-deoxy-L-arabinose transferase-like glycosyltransferase
VSVARALDAGDRSPPPASRVDLRIARALLLLALALVAIYGSDVARHVPVYGPIDEFYHVAYVQKVAESGHPPVLGNHLILGLGRTPPTSRDIAIRGLDHPYDAKLGRHVAPVFPDGQVFAQNEAIQPPLYYYAIAPIALVVPWSQRVLVMRLAGTAFVMLALLLLYAAVREVSPHRPLAAGLAAAILGSMAGLTGVLSQVQNDALLLPLCVATFWLLARDLRRRRAGLLLPLVAGATIITQLIAGPAAVVAVLAGLHGDARLRGVSWRSRAVLRLAASRIGMFALPVAPWVVFNLHEYRWFWPIVRGGDGGASAGAVTGDPGLYQHAVELLHAAVLGVMGGLWLQIWPVQNLFVATDLRPAAVIAFAGGAALVAALWSGDLLRERRRLAFWAAVMLVSFVGVFVVLLANASSTHGVPDFVARYFVAFAAAYAAFVGTAVAGISESRPWIVRGCSCGVALVLAWMMLDVAYSGVVG